MLFQEQLQKDPTGSLDPEKAPLYCHWDTHCEDQTFQSQSEFDSHLKSHFANNTVVAGDFGNEPVACHWDSCHETFVTVDSIMAHWQDYHFKDSFHPHYSENSCPRYDLGQEHSSLSGSDDPHMIVHHSQPCGHSHQHFHDGQRFVRIHQNEHHRTNGPDLSYLPDLVPSSRSSSVAPASDVAQECQCKWTVDGVTCNETFGSAADLKDHIESRHVSSRLHEYYCGWAGCERCNRAFPQRQKLIRHLQVHTRHRECKCHICNRLFSEESVLKQHMRTHSGEKPYHCSFCDKSFSSHSALTVHKRVHTGEKPLVCKVPGCGKRFSESSNLAKHMKTHRAREFECEVCHRKFARRDQLLRHGRTHKTRESSEESATNAVGGGSGTGFMDAMPQTLRVPTSLVYQSQ